MTQNGKIHKMTEDELFLPGKLINAAHTVTLTESSFSIGSPEVSETEKIRIIAEHFRGIMKTLGLDLTDDSLKDTPQRVAKMFVRETFSGLLPANRPSVALFDNKYSYRQMLVEKHIPIYSTCEHHFVPIIGKAHVGYVSSGKIIGLSKINRIVKFYSQRPQVQERLTVDIANELSSVLGTEDVAVVIEATHLCVSARGIRDTNSTTVTTEYRGVFSAFEKKDEFLKLLAANV
jgi:GTP cyclohydrolase I